VINLAERDWSDWVSSSHGAFLCPRTWSHLLLHLGPRLLINLVLRQVFLVLVDRVLRGVMGKSRAT